MDVDKYELEEDAASSASLLLTAGNFLRIFFLICSAVSCLQVECRPGYKKVVPEGECCPRCVLDNQCEEMQKKGVIFSWKFLIDKGYRCRTNCSEGYELVDTGKCCPHCKKVGRCETVRCAAPNCDERFWVRQKGL